MERDPAGRVGHLESEAAIGEALNLPAACIEELLGVCSDGVGPLLLQRRLVAKVVVTDRVELAGEAKQTLPRIEVSFNPPTAEPRQRLRTMGTRERRSNGFALVVVCPGLDGGGGAEVGDGPTTDWHAEDSLKTSRA